MMANVLSWLGFLIINVISASGYFGIGVFMTLESTCIPIPSEIVMPFAGFIASEGKFAFWLVVLSGTTGNLVGSLIAYIIGYYGGRPFIRRWGRYVFLHDEELEHADKWFLKYGSPAIFFSRLLPLVRTFISLPAGIGRMKLPKFIAYTFLGSLFWNFALTYIGLKLGQNWKNLEQYFRKFDYVILVLVIIGITWWVRGHLSKNKK